MSVGVDLWIFCDYNSPMKKKRGAPKKPKSKAKIDKLQIRVTAAEKLAFADAAEADGKTLSGWLRDRLRRDCRQELEQLGKPVRFLTGGADEKRVP
jgi:hypothetical protein